MPYMYVCYAHSCKGKKQIIIFIPFAKINIYSSFLYATFVWQLYKMDQDSNTPSDDSVLTVPKFMTLLTVSIELALAEAGNSAITSSVFHGFAGMG